MAYTRTCIHLGNIHPKRVVFFPNHPVWKWPSSRVNSYFIIAMAAGRLILGLFPSSRKPLYRSILFNLARYREMMHYSSFSLSLTTISPGVKDSAHLSERALLLSELSLLPRAPEEVKRQEEEEVALGGSCCCIQLITPLVPITSRPGSCPVYYIPRVYMCFIAHNPFARCFFEKSL